MKKQKIILFQKGRKRRVYDPYKVYVAKSKYHSVVPLKIYQTWFSKELPEHIKKSVEKLKTENPEFEYFLFDDNDCREFISSHFEENVVDAFDTLIPGAYKADLWRYCVLYVNGGIYLDIKYNCVNGFKLIGLTEQEWFVKDFESSNGGVYNALMVSKPKNPFYKQFIDKVVENVKNREYGENALCPTGPLMLKPFLTNYTYSLFHRTHNQMFFIFNKTLDIDILAVDIHYREEQRVYHNGKNHYTRLWAEKQIYKETEEIKN